MRKTKNIFITTLMIMVLIIVFLPIQKQLYSLENTDIYDLVLLIDESGSMKKNDPDNMRVEAAKLFVDLINVLGKGSRVSIVGFGENTNIYIPLTEISGNEDDIKNSINAIKSNQSLTDMKGALIVVKSMLDERQKQNKTAVIFLTDGKLDINDIPLPATGQKAGKTEGSKPDSPNEDSNPQVEKSNNSTDLDEQNKIHFLDSLQDEEDEDHPRGREEVERIELEEWKEEYLIEYKAELLNLCYTYRDDNIQIYPIAFTKEANIELLEKIALITYSATWKAETATDIRDIFLEIFEHITSGFIVTKEQTDNEPFIKEIEVSDYFIDLIAIALVNKNTAFPKIELRSPSGKISEYSKEIIESNYRIIKIEFPEQGTWSVEISGDAILVYHLVNSSILEPGDSFYLSGSGIPIKIELTEVAGSREKIDLSDFKVTYNIRYPDGEIKKDIELLDNGGGIDEERHDGIYSHLLTQADESGNYEVEFFIQHLPTMASTANSTESISFEIIDVSPMEIKSDNNPIAGTQSKIYANFQDFSEGDFKFVLSRPDGETTQGLLYDDGKPENGDLEEGDGIYSNILENLDILGEYNIEVTGINSSEDGEEFTQDQNTSFNKDFKITGFARSLKIEKDTTALDLTFSIISIHDEKIFIRLNDSKIDPEYIETLTLENGENVIGANSEKEIKINIQLKEGLRPGNYLIKIPLVLDEIYEKDIEIKLSYPSFIWQDYSMYILIASIILLITAIVLMVYFLIIKPRYLAGKT